MKFLHCDLLYLINDYSDLFEFVKINWWNIFVNLIILESIDYRISTELDNGCFDYCQSIFYILLVV